MNYTTKKEKTKKNIITTSFDINSLVSFTKSNRVSGGGGDDWRYDEKVDVSFT